MAAKSSLASGFLIPSLRRYKKKHGFSNSQPSSVIPRLCSHCRSLRQTTFVMVSKFARPARTDGALAVTNF
jgi:hypothetical protein